MNIEKSQLIRGAESDFVFIVGLEVHAQVRSKSKLFQALQPSLALNQTLT